MKKFNVVLIGLSSLLIIFFIGIVGLYYENNVNEKVGINELKVGLVMPMTGSLGYVGQMESDGIKMAVNDYNKENKDKNIKLFIEDSQGKPDIGVIAAKKLMDVNKVDIIVSSLSSVTLALKPVIIEKGKILIGCCMAPDFYKDSKYVFRFYEGVEQEAEGFLTYYRKLKEVNNVINGALYADVPNVRSQLEDYIRPWLYENDMDYKVLESYRLDDKEFRDKVLKIDEKRVNNLLILGYGFLYPNIFKSLKEQGLYNNIDIVGGWGFLYGKLPKEDLQRVTIIGPSYVFSGSDSISSFYSEFKSIYQYEANFDAAITYSAMQLIAKAYDNSLVDEKYSMLDELNSLSDVKTLLGDTTVDEYGAINFDIGYGIVGDIE